MLVDPRTSGPDLATPTVRRALREHVRELGVDVTILGEGGVWSFHPDASSVRFGAYADRLVGDLATAATLLTRRPAGTDVFVVSASAVHRVPGGPTPRPEALARPLLTQCRCARTRHQTSVPECPLDPSGPPSFDVGLGGDGIVDVLVARAGLPGRLDALEIATRCVTTERRGAIATVIRGAGLRAGARLALIAGSGLEAETDPLPAPLANTLAADLRLTLEAAVTAARTYATPLGPVDVRIEAVIPPPRLFVFGTGHDAVPVVQLGKQLGWDVIVDAPEPRHATRERFASTDEVLLGSAPELLARIDASDRALPLVLHHDADRDRAALGLLLPIRVHSVGVLGRPADARIHAPAGLELGAESPQELAIAAELKGALRQPTALAPREASTERPPVSRASDGFATIAAR